MSAPALWDRRGTSKEAVVAVTMPAFTADGTVTAGNSSGINDAAAAVVLASRGYADSHALAPLGRLVGYAHAGVEPRIMGMGPVPAVRGVLERTGLKVDDIDVFEVNEAFAPRQSRSSANSDCRRTGRNGTAAAYRSATRSARPARSSRSKRCTNCTALAGGTR
jgi:acetyl-CoA acetyltransferase